MSKSVSNVNITSDTFQSWVDKTNILLSTLNSESVTANSTLGNTVGNCHVNGYLAGNTLIACANIGGGSISANSSSLPQIFLANLNFITNTVFTSNTFINTGTTLTDGSIATHSNVHTFSSNVSITGANFILSTGTKLLANSVMGTSLQVLSSNGSSAYWRSIVEMQLVDSVANTSITLGATANAVKTAYDLASNGIIGFSRTYNANLTANGVAFVLSPTTKLYANGVIGSAGTVLTSNGSAVYWGTAGGSGVTVLDSVSNTSTTVAAAANSVTTAYNAAITANTNANTALNTAISANTLANTALTNAATAESDAQNANTRAYSAQTAATAAYSNAIAFSANATNLTSGIVAAARLSGSYAISVTGMAGGVEWLNVNNHPTDLSSFTNGPGYCTSALADTAYSNAIAYSANAAHLTSGTVPSARLSGSYGISVTGSAGSVAWTNVTGRPTAVSAFTNDAGYVTSTGSVSHASTADSATSASAVPFTGVTGANAVLRHVSTGYTSSARVFVSSTTPASPAKGDIWFQI